MNTSLLEQARQLDVQDQLALMEALWDGLDTRSALPHPTPAQKAELDRRLADLEANPHDAVPWSAVKAQAIAQLTR